MFWWAHWSTYGLKQVIVRKVGCIKLQIKRRGLGCPYKTSQNYKACNWIILEYRAMEPLWPTYRSQLQNWPASIVCPSWFQADQVSAKILPAADGWSMSAGLSHPEIIDYSVQDRLQFSVLIFAKHSSGWFSFCKPTTTRSPQWPTSRFEG